MFQNNSKSKAGRYLFLQGPHGPFFNGLAKMLRAAGAEVWRVGFNAGDRAFWTGTAGFIAFTDRQETWPDRFNKLADDLAITDIVLYGDTRPVHATAIARAKARGIRVHIFEEGYLRPYWVTYERGGSNGHSRLMNLDVAEMQAALDSTDTDSPEAPAKWGDMRQHIFYGALYHWFVMFRNRQFRHFKPHRLITVGAEFRLYLQKLLLSPALALDRFIATSKIKFGGFPYHLVLLQLEHDSSFQMHGPFENSADFFKLAIEGFAAGAPRHHHMVFKAHPLEDGRVPQRREIRRIAAAHNVSGRIHYVRGGKLARLLNGARSAITVNSTAGQQVLWRGQPLKVFGDAVYAKPEFVSAQPLADFFEQPARPDTRAYRDYRRFLLETSQVTGGFYSARGRRQLLRQVVDLMLAADDPYDALIKGNAAPRQQLQLVR